MPRISSEQPFDGAEALIQRLGLDELLGEVRKLITGFQFLIEERKDANSAKVLRVLIDAQFKAAGGWTQKKSGGVDWIKQQAINGRPRHISIGVEIQVSGRSDIISVDLIHLRKELLQGMIDLAVLVVPSDKLGYFLTDRVAKLSEAKRHIEMARADDMPFVLIAIDHDGPGPALVKQPKRSSKDDSKPGTQI
jgi:hypothetical protein